MRSLVAALCVAAHLPTGAPCAAAEPVAEAMRRIYAAEALTPLPTAAKTAATVAEMVEALRAADRYLAYEPPGVPPAPELGLVLSTLGPEPLLAPLPEGPAAAAGLVEPAYLVRVDGRPVQGLGAPEIRAAVADGEPPVELELRTAQGRRSVRLSPGPVGQVRVAEAIIGSALVLRLLDFEAGRTRREIAEAVARHGGLDAIVLDLRLNQGGSLYEALDAASLFLPPGLPLAGSRGRDGVTTRLESVVATPNTPSRPLVLLTSENTASAAEAFARALKVHKRALLIGRPTFGKCRSQRRAPLPDGGTLLLTNLILLDPGGEDCEGRPVQPDVLATSDELLDTAGLVAVALRRLGEPRGPTALCLGEGLGWEEAELAAAELAELFPTLPGGVGLEARDATSWRPCVGPFRGPEAMSEWRRRLSAGLSRSRLPVAIEEVGME